MSAAGDRARANARALRVAQLFLVACTLGGAAGGVTAAVGGPAGHVAALPFWLAGMALLVTFLVLARRGLELAGVPPRLGSAAMVALALIPCVSSVGVPAVLVELGDAYARALDDPSLRRRTRIAAIGYPVVTVLGWVVSGLLIARAPDAPAVGFTALPGLAGMVCLAAATYFLAAAARDLADQQGHTGAVGGGSSAAVPGDAT